MFLTKWSNIKVSVHLEGVLLCLHYYTWSYWDVNAVSTLRMMRDPKKTATIVLANRLQEVMALEVIELKLSEKRKKAIFEKKHINMDLPD